MYTFDFDCNSNPSQRIAIAAPSNTNFNTITRHAPSALLFYTFDFSSSFPQCTMKTIRRASTTGDLHMARRHLRRVVAQHVQPTVCVCLCVELPQYWRVLTGALVDDVINVIVIEMFKLSLSRFASPNLTASAHLNNKIVSNERNADTKVMKLDGIKNGKFSEIALNRAYPYISI